LFVWGRPYCMLLLLVLFVWGRPYCMLLLLVLFVPVCSFSARDLPENANSAECAQYLWC